MGGSGRRKVDGEEGKEEERGKDKGNEEGVRDGEV